MNMKMGSSAECPQLLLTSGLLTRKLKMKTDGKKTFACVVRDKVTHTVYFDTTIREVSLEKAKEWDSYKWLESLVNPEKMELVVWEGRDL